MLYLKDSNLLCVTSDSHSEWCLMDQLEDGVWTASSKWVKSEIRYEIDNEVLGSLKLDKLKQCFEDPKLQLLNKKQKVNQM